MSDNKYVIDISTKADPSAIAELGNKLKEATSDAEKLGTAVSSNSDDFNRFSADSVAAIDKITRSFDGVEKGAGDMNRSVQSSGSGFSTLKSIADSAIGGVVSCLEKATSRASDFFNSLSTVQKGITRVKSIADSAIGGVVSGLEKATSKASDFFNSLSTVQSGISSLMGAVGVVSVGDLVFGNSMKAEKNKVLIGQLTDTEAAAKSLYSTIDTATNKGLMSMQTVIPAVNAFAKATGASGNTLNFASEKISNFGSYVYALKGSSAEAETAMYDLSKGIDGAFASLDQFGITEESLMKTGLWNGRKDDIEGYLSAIEAVTGDTGALMNTAEGKITQITKKLSVAGKSIGNDLLPYIAQVADGILDLDKQTDGWSSKVIVGGAGIVSTFTMVAPQLESTFNLLGGMSKRLGDVSKDAEKYGGYIELLKKKFEGINSIKLDSVRDTFNNVKNAIFGTTVATEANTTAKGINTTATAGNTAAENTSILSKARNVITTTAGTIAESARTAATTASTAATWLLTAAMHANPAVWVSIAIITLIGALWYLYNTNESVRNAVDWLWASLQALGGYIYEGLVQAWNALIDALIPVWDALVELGGIIQGGLVQAWNSLVSTLQPVINLLTGVGGAGNAAGGVLDWLGGIVGTVSSAVGGFIGWLQAGYNSLVGTSDAIRRTVDSMGALGYVVSFILNPIGLLQALWEDLTRAWDDFKQSAEGVEIFNQLNQAVTELQTAFGEVQAAFDEVGKAFSDIFNELSEAFREVQAALAPVWDAFGELFNTISSLIWPVQEASEAMEETKDTTQGAAPPLSVVSGIIKIFASILTDFVIPAIKVFAEILKGVAWVITTSIAIWRTITGVFIEVATVVWNFFKPALDLIVSVVVIIINYVGSLISIFWNLLTGQITLGEALGQIWDLIKVTAMQIFGEILEYISDFAGGLIQKGLEAGSGFVNSIISFLASLPGRAWTWLLNTIQKVIDFAGNVKNKAIAAGKEILDGIINKVKELPGKVAEEMRKIAERVMNAGKDFVDAAKKAAGQLVDAFLGRLHINSPGILARTVSREMNYIVDGIKNAQSPAAAAARGLGEAIVTGFGNPSLESDIYSNANLGFDANEINSLIHANQNDKEQAQIIQYNTINQEGIMSMEEAADFIVNAVTEQLKKENLIKGKSG